MDAPSTVMTGFGDLCRPVYCICGIPVDAVTIAEAARKIRSAAVAGTPFLFSTPNLNFLTTSLKDSEFRESLLESDLCTADGTPIMWIARMLGLPVTERAAGSDIFEALKFGTSGEEPLNVFFFGATEESASLAAKALNNGALSVRCVGFVCPGFGTVAQMSAVEFIDTINRSNADFLVAALGAQKGQAWLMQNHDALRVPVRAHLGATIHFQAGTIRRSPPWIRRFGMEWLWRIREEPKLWRRYCSDGFALLRLLLTRVLPLAIEARRLRSECAIGRHNLVIDRVENADGITFKMSGFAVADQVSRLIPLFADALTAKEHIAIDLSMINAVDARFLGLLLVLRKQARQVGLRLEFIGLSPKLTRTFRLQGVEHLLTTGVTA